MANIERWIVEHDLVSGSLLRQTQAELERERIHRREVQAVRDRLKAELRGAVGDARLLATWGRWRMSPDGPPPCTLGEVIAAIDRHAGGR